MKTTHRWIPHTAAACLGAVGMLITSLAATTPLPATAALPLGSGTGPGFVVRTVQGPFEPALLNNSIRALKQINGTLTDAAGDPVPDEAFPGGNADGSHDLATLSYEKDALTIDLVTLDGIPLATFFPGLFPGIPGQQAHTDNFALEAVGFLELSAGVHTFGMSVTADRTDVNNDDGYVVYVATNPRDFFGLKVGEYQRIAPGFQANWRNENQFSVQAPVAGLYPFRILYWQTGLGASLNFYTVNTATEERILVNDEFDNRAIKAFRSVNVPAAIGPYVAEAAPAPGSDGNSPSAPIEAILVDGATTVAPSGVKLFLNDVAVTPQLLTKVGNQIQLRYDPNVNRTDAANAVRIEYTDSSSVTYTSSFNFRITVAGGSGTTVAGQWDFNNGDLRATVGAPLTYLDPLTEQGTRFGTTTALGVPDIGGEPAQIMEVPGDVDRRIGYVMTPGIAPNGGGTRVNQYTLIMDVFVDTEGPGAASLWQVSSPDNTDDGDLFWQGNNFGQGTDGYIGRGTFTAGEWHRVVAAYDMAASPPVVTKYVDGIKQHDWTANQGLDNPRRSLGATAVLFADGDQDERRRMWVNSVQIRAGKITDAEAVVLGGPTAAGIPQTFLADPVAGQWDFAFGDLGATIGKPLQYLDGPGGLTETGTAFGTTTDLGVVDIDGEPAMVMRVPGDLDRNIGYLLDHGIAPNGGGTRVNQYTLIMDVLVATTGPGAASLWQVSSPDNTDDGDLFWQGSNFGQGTDGYRGRGTFTAGEWHRVVAAYDMAADPPVVTKYVDGIKQDDWTANQGLDNVRRSLGPLAVLFGDGDQDERRELWANSIQIRPGKLTDAQMAALGGPSAAGIPVNIPKSTVTGQWDFAFGDLGASIGRNLRYLDGAGGLTELGTQFGTTGVDGFVDVPLINGEPAQVMYVPGDLDRNIGYVMEHLIAPNGGGTRVNQYTLIMDVLVGTTGPGAASMWQVSSADNTDDGDLFWQGSNFGQGTDGYIGTGIFLPGEWHRVVAAYNMAANPPVVTKYVDGVFQHDWTANQGLDNPRRSLGPTAVLFADGDQDERREWWVNAVQIRAGALSKPEIESLGGPSAAGIPVVLDVAPPPPAPALAIGWSAGNLTISWPAEATGYTLESAPAVSGAAWTPVSGVTGNSVTITPTGAAGFYRLRQ